MHVEGNERKGRGRGREKERKGTLYIERDTRHSKHDNHNPGITLSLPHFVRRQPNH